MSTSCPHEETLFAWLDGELSGPAAAEFEQHLASCPRCRAAHGALSALQPALQPGSPLFLQPHELERFTASVQLKLPPTPLAPSATGLTRWLHPRLGALRHWQLSRLVPLLGFAVGWGDQHTPAGRATSTLLACCLLLLAYLLPLGGMLFFGGSPAPSAADPEAEPHAPPISKGRAGLRLVVLSSFWALGALLLLAVVLGWADGGAFFTLDTPWVPCAALGAAALSVWAQSSAGLYSLTAAVCLVLAQQGRAFSTLLLLMGCVVLSGLLTLRYPAAAPVALPLPFESDGSDLPPVAEPERSGRPWQLALAATAVAGLSLMDVPPYELGTDTGLWYTLTWLVLQALPFTAACHSALPAVIRQREAGRWQGAPAGYLRQRLRLAAQQVLPLWSVTGAWMIGLSFHQPEALGLTTGQALLVSGLTQLVSLCLCGVGATMALAASAQSRSWNEARLRLALSVSWLAARWLSLSSALTWLLHAAYDLRLDGLVRSSSAPGWLPTHTPSPGPLTLDVLPPLLCALGLLWVRQRQAQRELAFSLPTPQAQALDPLRVAPLHLAWISATLAAAVFCSCLTDATPWFKSPSLSSDPGLLWFCCLALHGVENWLCEPLLRSWLRGGASLPRSVAVGAFWATLAVGNLLLVVSCLGYLQDLQHAFGPLLLRRPSDLVALWCLVAATVTLLCRCNGPAGASADGAAPRSLTRLLLTGAAVAATLAWVQGRSDALYRRELLPQTQAWVNDLRASSPPLPAEDLTWLALGRRAASLPAPEVRAAGDRLEKLGRLPLSPEHAEQLLADLGRALAAARSGERTAELARWLALTADTADVKITLPSLDFALRCLLQRRGSLELTRLQQVLAVFDREWKHEQRRYGQRWLFMVDTMRAQTAPDARLVHNEAALLNSGRELSERPWLLPEPEPTYLYRWPLVTLGAVDPFDALPAARLVLLHHLAELRRGQPEWPVHYTVPQGAYAGMRWTVQRDGATRRYLVTLPEHWKLVVVPVAQVSF